MMNNSNLIGFRVIPPSVLIQNKGFIKEVLFGGTGIENFSIKEKSAYIHFSKKTKINTQQPSQRGLLPKNEHQATQIAFDFIESRYQLFAQNKAVFETQITRNSTNIPIEINLLPNPKWLKHFGTYPIANNRTGQLDHWLVKYLIEIKLPNNLALPVVYGSINIRIGEFSSNIQDYEVIEFNQKWRPIYEAFRVEKFLATTRQKDAANTDAHGHSHGESETKIGYVLNDEASSQNLLLPYEITVSGEHHLNIIPASKLSLWVELNTEVVNNQYIVQALVMGGSGHFEAKWAYWQAFGGINTENNLQNSVYEKKTLLLPIKTKEGNLLQLSQFQLPIKAVDVGFYVKDTSTNLEIEKVISLQISPIQQSNNSITA